MVEDVVHRVAVVDVAVKVSKDIQEKPAAGEGSENTGGALWDIFRREDSEKLQDVE